MYDIVKLDGKTLDNFLLTMASCLGEDEVPSIDAIRFAIDEGGFKVKIGSGTWTPALGSIEPGTERPDADPDGYYFAKEL